MGVYELRLQVIKHTSDRDEQILEEYSYEVNQKDVDGLIGWVNNLFNGWFWS